MTKHTFCSLLIAVFLVGCTNDTLDASYDSTSDAVAAQAVSKGWIPPWLPPEASNLMEVHNLDSSSSALSFKIPDGQVWELPSHCRPVGFSDTSPSKFSRSWWPSTEELGSSFDFFQCQADASPDFTFVAIHKMGGRGLHWRAYAR